MKRKIIPYSPKAKQFAYKLRQQMTLLEVLLWNKVKNKQMLGHDFDRQRAIDKYIVDFYCKELMLAIEVDGAHHDYYKDRERQEKLEEQGVRFLRFTNTEVLYKMDKVLASILLWIEGEHDKKPNPALITSK